MGKKKEKAQQEKSLDKMTAKELRDLALTLEGIVGVHAMNKTELIAAVKEAKGIVDAPGTKKSVDMRSIKLSIAQLREKRTQAKAEGKKKLADSLRRRISRLKKKTRRAA